MDEAAKGITNAATAQEAAEAAQKTADQAKKIAESIDLTPYVTKTELAETAEAAKTEITNALANYLTADAIEKKLDALKQEVADANAEQLEEMQTKVKNATEAVNSIWSAVTSISLYAAVSPANNPSATGGGETLTTYYTSKFLNLNFCLDKINNGDKRFTRVNVLAAAGKENLKDGLFGDPDNKDFFNGAANYAASKQTYTNGSIFKFPTEIIVRVSPTNATLKAEDIKLMSADGIALDQVEVASVAPYAKVLTRGGSESGLWSIKLNAVDGADAKAGSTVTINKMQAATLTNATNSRKVADINAAAASARKQVLFAVAVNNTKDVEAADGRYVVSEYGLTVAKDPITLYTGIYDTKTGTNDILALGKVNTLLIKNVGGRTKVGGTTIAGANAQDYVWNDENNNNVTETAATDRTGTAAVAINNGGTVTVDLTGVAKNGFTPQYYYVVRDDANAGGSDASELNAWNTYSYGSSLGKIFTFDQTCEFDITIPETSVKGDYIGFRIFAVNYDGTLVDPDGVPFEVYVGANNADVTANVVVKPFNGKTNGDEAIYYVVAPISGALQNGTATFPAFTKDYTFTIAAGVDKVFTATFNGLSKDGELVTAGNAFKTPITAADKYADAKYVLFKMEPKTTGTKWAGWPDDATKTASLIATSAKGVPENTLKVTFSKALPTAADMASKWSWKDNQKVGGVYTAYMYPETASLAFDDSWTKALNAADVAPAAGKTGYAYKSMNNAINGLSKKNGTNYEAVVDYEFEFKTSKKKDDAYTESITVTSANSEAAAATATEFYALELTNGKPGAVELSEIADLLDGTTQHETLFKYNFGEISSSMDYDATADAWADYKVTLDEFKTVYACPLSTTAQKFDIAQPALAAWTEGTLIPGAGVWKEGAKAPVNYIIYNQTVVANDKNFFDIVKAADIATPGTLNNANYFDNAANKGVELANYIVATNSYDNSAFADGGFKGTLKDIIAGLYVDKKFTVVSNGSKEEDYYTVTYAGGLNFTRLPSATTNPQSDVASKFNMILTDCFGHKNTYSFDFTVKRAE
jgi:hypothetical protein